jgi:hypothetical protein
MPIRLNMLMGMPMAKWARTDPTNPKGMAAMTTKSGCR